LLMVVGFLMSPGQGARRATVTIDTNGTARLGGVLPLKNPAVRDAALSAVSHLNGGTASVVAGQATAFSDVVEMVKAMQKAGITSVTLRTEGSTNR
jgi:biopolymer transport protein ExbD